MKKILLAEVIVLLILVVFAVVIRVGNALPLETNNGGVSMEQPTEAPTDDPTQGPTETDPPTDPPTEPPTQPPTEPPTQPPTQEPTRPPEPESPGIPVPPGVTVSADRYFVYDLQEERFLAISCHEDAALYPASITKLFTAYLALQYLDPETVITAGDELDLVKKGSSLAYIQKGHRLTVEMLVEGMMLPSGNDAAYILAAAAARAANDDPNMSGEDAIDYFVQLMNTVSKRVGMTGSNFRNPDGFHVGDHYTTCHDLTIIARLALNNEVICRYTSTVKDDVRFESGQTIEWKNTNALINPSSKYYCHTAIGLKTGSTGAAGYCLLSAFKESDGKIYIIGVFDCDEKNDRFVDTQHLYWGLICE